MPFDNAFHRIFLSATATIAFSVIVSFGYIAKNESLSLATDGSNTTSCPTELVTLLNNDCRNMGNAYFNGAMDHYILPGTIVVQNCSTNYISGCATGSSNTTCPSGQYWNGAACVNSTTTVSQKTQTWNSLGLSSQIRTDADPERISQLKQHCANVPNGANVWLPNAGDFNSVDFGIPDPAKCALAAACTSTQYFNGTACVATAAACPSGQSWSGTACVSNTTDTTSTSSCPTTITALLGSTCRNMGNAYFNGAMDKYVLPNTSTIKACATEPITNCAGQSPWSVPTDWKEMIWNNLGLRSYISINAPQTVIDAAKTACANTAPDKAIFQNPSDFSKPETAGIPTCSNATTATIYPFRFSESGYTCANYQDCFNYCKTAPSSAMDDVAICDRHFPGATTYQDSQQLSGQITGFIKDEAGGQVSDFYGVIYADSSGALPGGAVVERGQFSFKIAPGNYKLKLESPASSTWTAIAAVPAAVQSGQTTNINFVVKKNTAALWGFIVDSAGKPIFGQPFRVSASGSNGGWQTAMVDQTSGKYLLNLAAGTWYLKVYSADADQTGLYHFTEANVSITVSAGAQAQKDLTVLPGSASIAGVVLRPDNQPFAESWVAVESPPAKNFTSADTTAAALSGYTAGAKTDAQGKFTITVPPGSYYVSAFAAAESGLLNPERLFVALSAGDRKDIILKFRSTNTAISGGIFIGASPLADAFISAWSEQGGFVSAKSAADGKYILRINSTDDWHITASAKYEDALYRSSTIVIKPSSMSRLIHDFALDKEKDLPPPVTTTTSANQPAVVSTADGTRVSLPANSVAAAGKATVTITPDAETPEQASAQIVGIGYTVKAYNEQGQQVSKLASAITITIPYDPAEISKKGVDVKSMKIAYWDETSGAWKHLAASLVNEAEHLVTATVEHLTRFAIVAAADITPPDQPIAVSAKANADGSISLSWSNPAKDFSHAKIYRSSEIGILGIVIATDLAGQNYTDKNTTAGNTFHYTVRAVDPAGNESVNTNQVTATAKVSAMPQAKSEQPSAPSAPSALAVRLSGRILLQVEAKGEAWYVYPKTKERYYLGRPADAFAIMRSLGLGITNADLSKIPLEQNSAAAISAMSRRTIGYILLQVEAKGEAWYVNPLTGKRHYLGRPADAFAIMRSLGLGITNADLSAIHEP